MGHLRSCVVSYQDNQGIRHSAEVTAETLYEAAVLGLQEPQAAQAIAALMSDKTAWMTGNVIRVDGGEDIVT